jgi:endogenous inhibitor of DNA gyrase (YacG/DUF329 family)
MERIFRRQCPQCSRLVMWPATPTYPFCSERCRLIDLGAWAQGEYRIPSEPVADDEAWPEVLAEEDEEEPY